MQYDWCPYKRRHLETARNKGRMTCENEGRYWGNAADGKESQRLPANHQKLTERHGTVSLQI